MPGPGGVRGAAGRSVQPTAHVPPIRMEGQGNQMQWYNQSSLIFLGIGMLVVLMFAWRRFNEPSFPNNETLPRTVDPLRYLFISSAYIKARRVYSLGFILLYVLLILPGASTAAVLGISNKLPAEAWVLGVAIVMVEIAPNAGIKWLNLMEETWRKWVHSWFLVPDGILKTAAILQDAKFSLTPEQLEALPDGVRDRINAGLQLAPNLLRARWARARALLDSVLRTDAFADLAAAPFQDDFKDLKRRYRALRDDIAPYLSSTPALTTDGEPEEAFENVDTELQSFLRSVYIYVSWVVLYSAQNERDVDQRLRDLGFSIPPRGERRTFDIMAAPAIMVGLVTTICWLAAPLGPASASYDVVAHVTAAASAGVANSLFYGLVLYLALHLRSDQIDEKTWREGSPRCLAIIAVKTGLTAYATIVVVGVVSALIPVWLEAFSPQHSPSGRPGVYWLQQILGPVPWFLVGATVGVMVARSVGRNIQRTAAADRIKDALRCGVLLALAAGAAQLLQNTINQQLLAALVTGFHPSDPTWDFIINPLEIAMVGGLCGAIIGFMVPHAFRRNILEPGDLEAAGALQDLIDRATTAFGSAEAAREWVFHPTPQFKGLTPAEARSYQAYAVTVFRYLRTDVAGRQRRAAAAKELSTSTPAAIERRPEPEDHP